MSPSIKLFEDEEVNTATIELAKALNQGWGGAITSFGFVIRYKHGRIDTKVSTGRWCFANVPALSGKCYHYPENLKNPTNPNWDLLTFVVCSKPRSGLWDDLKKYEQVYVKWVIKDSPFSKAFLSKDPEWVINNSAVMDMRYSSQYILSAGVALRYLNEFPDRVRFWYYMKNKITPELALLASQYGGYSFNPRSIKRWSGLPSPVFCNHSIFNSRIDITGLRNYLSHNMENEGKLPRATEVMDIQYFHKIWNEGADGSWKIPKGAVKKTKVKDDWGGYNFISSVVIAKWLPEFVKDNSLEDVIDVEKKKCVHN